ncbi:MAG: enoyl-CoA hydratase/isomerase family protein, partial [Mycobacteriales bacterium]
MTAWTVDQDCGVATLTLTSPPRNFLTFAILLELDEQLARIGAHPDVRVVMLASGVPGYFAAHADLDEVASLHSVAPPDARAWYVALRRMESIPQPVIAVVDGQAWGGGFELALASTLRWVTDRASFALPEIRLGLLPGAGGVPRLTRLIGAARTAALALTGDELNAKAA